MNASKREGGQQDGETVKSWVTESKFKYWEVIVQRNGACENEVKKEGMVE